jgi:AAA domain
MGNNPNVDFNDLINKHGPNVPPDAFDEVIEAPKPSRREPRFKLRPFASIEFKCEAIYLVKRLIPRSGLIVVWGPPKCGKSLWTFDLVMHIALGRSYRGRRVKQGPCVYCAFEGADGFKLRVEAFRKKNVVPDDVPFFLVAARMDMAKDHRDLITSIRAQIGHHVPAVVVLDTLNRSMAGSESKDEDMAGYVKAADAIREAFGCAVIIVHHSGVDGTRPRGHTSLTGAADAQLAVKRDAAENVNVTVEWMKDGPEGDVIVNRLERVPLGHDEDGEEISSCVVIPVNDAEVVASRKAKLNKNQETMFSILRGAGKDGLTTEDWYERAKEVGIGTKRKADLYDLRRAIEDKKLAARLNDGRWHTIEAATAQMREDLTDARKASK